MSFSLQFRGNVNTGRFLLAISFGLLAGCVVCYLARWDTVAVLTLLPFWAWGLLGILLSAAAWRIRRGWTAGAMAGIWLGATLFLSDDLSGLLLPCLKSSLSDARPQPGRTLRVISLNCASQASAAREVLAWNPDIVLLQESPSSNDVARLCHEGFGTNGGFLCGLDCSIIARGQITAPVLPRTLRFVEGQVRLPDGFSVQAASVRLLPPDIRLDLWSRECWAQHTRGRQIRRAQLEELVQSLPPSGSPMPLVVGGDFNAPAGDAIYRLLKGRLRDSFREAGRGWGNTAINTIPLSRPDQIWVSPALQARKVWVKKTENSDHRMVICDLVIGSK